MSTDTQTDPVRNESTDPRQLTDLMIVGTLGGGGIHQYIDEQAERLQSDLSVRVYDMTTPSNGSGIVWFLAAFFRSLWAAFKFPFRPRPDVVHVHTSHQYSFYRASVYVLFVAYVWRRPVILHVHGSSFDEFARTDVRSVRWVQSIVFAAVERIVVLSEYWEDVLASRVDEEKLKVLPNAVDPDEYDPQFDSDPPHVVFVSNLVERKGVRELVTALDTLEGRDAPFRATIAGKGPLADQVEDLAAGSKHVDYLGYVSEERKRQLLDAGAVFVLPTYAEGLPIAMLEGMAGGNAVVSTTVGSIPEVITDENGRLVEPGDPEALADALESLVRDPETARRMASQNRSLVEERYSWERTTTQLERMYALQGRPASASGEVMRA